jgi:hypothetical protein
LWLSAQPVRLQDPTGERVKECAPVTAELLDGTAAASTTVTTMYVTATLHVFH